MNALFKTPTTISSREFNQNRAKVKREARKGPVVVTERGVPSLVVMTVQEFEEIRRLAEQAGKAPGKPFRSLADALAQKEGGDFDFEFPEFKGSWSLRIPELD